MCTDQYAIPIEMMRCCWIQPYLFGLDARVLKVPMCTGMIYRATRWTRIPGLWVRVLSLHMSIAESGSFALVADVPVPRTLWANFA